MILWSVEMSERVILDWNIRNWITVVLMVLVGFALVSLMAQGYHKFAGNTANGG